MKNIRLFLLLFLISGVLFSCEDILENKRLKEEQDNQTSPYMGRWVGTYTGSENGNLVLDIKKSGSVEVIRTINNTQDVYYTNLYGGAIYNTASPNSGFVLYGNMENHSGTWKMGAGSGNWSVTKQ
ncbi:hypothetical protein [Chryseobacterium gleum]|uniref:hypothetical protein n=1 Tax=Chryseobacterium gleum TaxID=250 RepID=UPI0028A79C74|nr:hypothetical protein [Chryseobacterium gleum]